MTEFITRGCHAEKSYEVIIKTDSEEHYKATQDFARRLIDHAEPEIETDRKQGRWIWRRGLNRESECICSECGKHAPYTEDGEVDMTTFCPHCASENRVTTLLLVKTCPVCGKQFTAESYRNKYCGDFCRQRAQAEYARNYFHRKKEVEANTESLGEQIWL